MPKQKERKRVALFMDEATLEKLRARAKKTGRTMVGELRRLLANAKEQ